MIANTAAARRLSGPLGGPTQRLNPQDGCPRLTAAVPMRTARRVAAALPLGAGKMRFDSHPCRRRDGPGCSEDRAKGRSDTEL